MANRTATLYIRITTADGKRRYCKAAYQSKGRLRPQYALVNGEPEHHEEGVYYVRFGADGGKQQFVLAGKDPYVALDKLEEKKRWLRDRERQVVPQAPVNSKPQTSKLSMDDAVEQYFKNLHSQGKDPKTIRAYTVAVEEFRKSCTKKFLAKFSQTTLEHIEQGHGNPGLTRMMNLAHALKHTLSYLFRLTEELNDSEKL